MGKWKGLLNLGTSGQRADRKQIETWRKPRVAPKIYGPP